MADYTYDELKKKTVAEMRAIAKGLDREAVKGYSQLNKEHLLPLLCKALGIEAHQHHELKDDFDKSAIKAKMRELKAARTAALEAHDKVQLKAVRRHLLSLNHQIRAHLG